ncbi:MAG: hypothetical protein AAGA77_06480 [Bacteroidota bacterium]
MVDPYHNFFREDTLKKAKAYQETLVKEIQKDYGYATAPLIMTPERYQRIIDKTHALVAFLGSEKYFKELTKKQWFLKQLPLRTSDYFGCIDFMLTPDGNEKLQELTLFPSGRLGALGAINESFKHYYTEYSEYNLDKDLDYHMVKSVTKGFQRKRIAIAVNHLASSKDQFAQYRNVAKIFRRFGIEAQVHLAKDIQVTEEGKPCFEGKVYDGVFNLLIPLIWEWNQTEFTAYTEFFNNYPEIVIPNPLGMRMGNKSILAKLWEDDLKGYQLDSTQIELIRDSILKAVDISRFADLDELKNYFDHKELVIKPDGGYQGKGVMIKPDDKDLKTLLKKNQSDQTYYAQEFCPSIEVPQYDFEKEKIVQQNLIKVRSLVINKKCVGMRGYAHTQQKPEGYSFILPTIVVDDLD